MPSVNTEAKQFQLTREEKRLWIRWKVYAEAGSSNTPAILYIEGRLDSGRFLDSIAVTVSQFHALHLYCVETKDNEGMFAMCSEEELLSRSYLSYHDFSSDANPETSAREFACNFVSKGFNLQKFPLHEHALIKYGIDKYIYATHFAHIIIDGRSWRQFTSLLSAVYQTDHEIGVASQVRQYERYANREDLQKVMEDYYELKDDLDKKASAYWKNTLKDAQFFLDFSTRLPSLSNCVAIPNLGTRLRNKLTRKISQSVEEFAKSEKTTLFCIFATAVNVLLYRYFGQEDITMAYTVDVRPIKRNQFMGLLDGYHVNDMLLRTQVDSKLNFRQLCQKVTAQRWEDRSHQHYHLIDEIMPQIRKKYPDSDGSFSNVMISQSPLHTDILRLGPEIRCSPDEQEITYEETNYDLTFIVDDHEFKHSGGVIEYALFYRNSKFTANFARRMSENLLTLLTNLFDDQGKLAIPIGHVPILGHEEVRLLQSWNNTYKAEYMDERTILELIRDQVKKNPDALSLVSDVESITYGEMWNGANQLARYLLNLEVKPENLVCMLMSRSVHAFVTTIGILNSGAAYLPIDPDYPLERIAFMLKESGANYMVAERKLYDNSRLRPLIDKFQGFVIFYDDPIWRKSVSLDELETIAKPANLAYVIFTSGSTGKPKGVMMNHSSLRNLARCYAKVFEIDNTARVLQFSSICFDATVGDWASAFSSGAALVIVSSAAQLVGAGFMDTVNRHKVTYCLIPTSMLNTFPEEEIHKLASMRALSIGAEPPNLHLMNRWKNRGFMLMNSYGPTETCVITTTTQFTGEKHYACIGKPLPNYQTFMLDSNQQILPAGLIGEMCIAGSGLARGFINQPQLTKERYPMVDLVGFGPTRVYRSGDTAVFLEDGEIQFIGRMDFQVKIRGFRIELGEIENNIRQQNAVDVSDALVLAQEDKMGIKRLVGYVILLQCHKEKDHKELASKIRQELKRLIPSHMVPSHILIMKEYPVSPNGKIERKLLPNPVANISEDDLKDAWTDSTSACANQNLQDKLQNLFTQLLELDHIGVNENFFDMGANSLLIVKAHSIIKQMDSFKDLTLVHLFKYPTIHSLIKQLEENQSEEHGQIDHVNVGLGNAEGASQDGLPDLNGIAIIGISCRTPGAKNHMQFWENLRNGEESVSFYTDDELIASGVPIDELKHPNYVKAMGAMDSNAIQTFDAEFFGMTPREALITDPQQRVFLECSWEALENAGYNPVEYSGRIGVFAGVGMNRYLQDYILPQEALVGDAGAYPIMIGNAPDFLATRVAYKLALRGPAITIQTACSSSLVAVHQAKNAIRNGECDMVLAGGVSFGPLEKSGYIYREGFVASPDGHCRAFDQNSKGTVLGQGCGVILLKSLRKAMADNDHIYAVLKGSGINNDGSLKVGFTAPSVQMQAAAISNAHRDAAINPQDISYIETHGTGTLVGDVIELEALNDAFASVDVKNGPYCAIASAKTNIGHTDTAAGVIGLIKTTLALYYEHIPPHLHFKEPNSQIDWVNSPFYVVTKLTQWKKVQGLSRIAGVSSFGMGGTNVHAIVEEAPTLPYSKQTYKLPWYLLNVSAFNGRSLQENTKNLIQWLRSPEGNKWNLRDIACTLAIHRSQFPSRQVLMIQEISELETLEQNVLMDRIISATKSPESAISTSLAGLKTMALKEKHIVFLFPGQGSQYITIGRELYRHFTVFSGIVDECLQYANNFRGSLNLPDIFRKGENIQSTEVSQPLIFIIEYALAKTLQVWGVQPNSLIGHSLGEYVVACLAGVFSLEDAIKVVIFRGELMSSVEPKSSMLSVRISKTDLKRHIEKLGEARFDYAVENSPEHWVIAGEFKDIEDLQASLSLVSISCRILNTSHGFHSRFMDPILSSFSHFMSGIPLSKPIVPFVSSVSGTWITHAQVTQARYWVEHLRKQCRFGEAVQSLLKCQQADILFVEVGPGRGLSTLVKANSTYMKINYMDTIEPITITTMPASYRAPVHSGAESFAISKAMAQLWSEGVQVNWEEFYMCRDVPSQKVPLPTYAFDRKTFMLKKSRTSFTSITSPQTLPQKHNWTPEVILNQVEKITPTEAIVRNVWKSFLMLDSSPSVKSDYFNLGGDSMMAVQLVGRINQLFDGADLGIHTLLENPTIERLSRYIDSVMIAKPHGEKYLHTAFDSNVENGVNDATATLQTIGLSNSNNESLVQLKKGTGNALFLVHPVGGDIFGFRSLVNRLPDNIPVYAFRAPFVNEPRYSNIKEMAATYIELLLFKLDSVFHQDILLGGHSMGGVVVYEMIQQLSCLQCNVSRILLLDPPLNPVSTSILPKTSFMPILDDPVDIVEYIFGHRVQIERDFKEIPLTEAVLEVCTLLAHDIEALDLKMLSGLTSDVILSIGRTWIHNYSIMQEYQPELMLFNEKNRNNIVLYIRNSEPDGYFPPYAHVAYQDAMLNSGFEFRLVQVPGNHQTMLLEPHAEHVANIIAQLL